MTPARPRQIRGTPARAAHECGCQRQLLDAARGGEAAGGFPELQLVAVLQAPSFQTANPRLEIRAARAKDLGNRNPARHRQIAANAMLRRFQHQALPGR